MATGTKKKARLRGPSAGKKRGAVFAAKRKPAATIGRPTKLTPKTQKAICAFVRKGAFAWVAAQACGVGPSTFYRWMAEGARKDAPKNKRDFREQVDMARAQARVLAEIDAKAHHTVFWLRNGPGKTKRGQPGWTDPMGETPVDSETGAPVESVDAEALLAKLDGIRQRVTAEKRPAKAREGRPTPKPRG